VNPKAVIFDYFGTLTVSVPASTRRAGVGRVAAALGVPADLLYGAISSTFTQRSTGECGDLPATLAWVADRCGHQPSAAQLAAACAERYENECGYARRLRGDSVDTLRWLHEHGMGVGVVSDCTHELPDYWAHLPVAPEVDVTVFSIVMGKRKPHPSMYLAACDGLGIAPSQAIYVGDGGSNELTGAVAVGMTAIRLVAEDAAEALVYDAEPDWTGPVIHSLTALTSALLSTEPGLPTPE
jgi:putative hydrolase of the HAD superfamily